MMLNLAPRALWRVAEQLLGKGTVVWPAGLDESGYTTGPCFMCDDAVGGLNTHLGGAMGFPSKGSFTTEPALRLPKTGPVWLNGQGTRGLYCTLPNSPSHAPHYSGAHSDGPCYGTWRLQMSAYIADVPPNCGGFTVWPGVTRASGGNSGRLSKLARNTRTNIWRYGWQGVIPTPSSVKSRRIPNRSIAMDLPVLLYCGTPKFYTSRDRTRLATLSVKRQFTDSRKHPSRFPTRSWWITQMATSGGTGRMKCVRNRRC